MKICQHLLSLKLFQTCISLFLLFKVKEDNLKNFGNQIQYIAKSIGTPF